MFCAKCGTKLEDGAKFCYVCGAKQSEPSSDVQITSDKKATDYAAVDDTHEGMLNGVSYSNDPGNYSGDQQHTQIGNDDPESAKKKKKLKWWQIVLIVIGVLLVLFIVIGAIGSGEDKPQNTDIPSGNYSNDPSDYTPPSSAKSSKSKTVMIYIVGSDLESSHGSASVDIVEMLDSGVNTDKNNILIYTGGTSEWMISEIPANQNSIYRLNGGNFVLEKSFDSLNMGSSQTLADFISYCKNNYSADEYGLILWDHGAGPMFGYGVDELHGNDLLELDELQTALSSAGFGSGNKFEFLGFDACLMGTIETAWSVKDYANYFIASQELEPGCGWDYSFLKQLEYYDSGKDIGRIIVDSYISGYKKELVIHPQKETSVTLSCLDLSKIGNVETCLDDLFEKVDSNILSGCFPQVSRCRYNTKAFGKTASTFNYDLIDLGHIVSLLSSDYKNESENLGNALNDFVCYSKSNTNNVTGISIYHPYDNTDYMDIWINSFKSFGFADKYTKYISDFGALLSSSDSSLWRNFKASKGSSVKNNSINELSIQLTEEQKNNYAGSNYYILKKIKDDQYLFVFSGIDAQLNSQGVLSATYKNKAVFAVNDKTKEVSDSPITMYQIHDGSDELKYFATSIFWDCNDEDISKWKTDPVELQIKIDNDVPKALGAFLIESSNGEEIPQKHLLDYKDYTYIEFSFSTRIPKRDSVGNLLPYFDWNSTGDFYGNQYNVADGFHLEYREIDNKDDYYVMFVVNDVHGNKYASELFSLAK